jgi:heat shock protein HslJ
MVPISAAAQGHATLDARHFLVEKKRMWIFASLRRVGGLFAVLAVLTVICGSVRAQEFPFDTELLLDANPMRGSKRVPILTVGSKGDTLIELWCNSVQAQFVVVGDTLTVLTGQKSERQCDPDRMRADDDLLAALLEVTSWRWENDILVLRGSRPVRLRRSTH